MGTSELSSLCEQLAGEIAEELRSGRSRKLRYPAELRLRVVSHARVCRGAGGGRMWLEEKLGERINQTRFGQLKATGTKNVGIACPYCWAMLSDAQRELGHEHAKTWHVIELVAMAMGEPKA